MAKKRQTTYRNKESSKFCLLFFVLVPFLTGREERQGHHVAERDRVRGQSESSGQTTVPVWEPSPLLSKGHFSPYKCFCSTLLQLFSNTRCPVAWTPLPFFKAANFPSGANSLFTRPGIRGQEILKAGGMVSVHSHVSLKNFMYTIGLLTASARSLPVPNPLIFQTPSAMREEGIWNKFSSRTFLRGNVRYR